MKTNNVIEKVVLFLLAPFIFAYVFMESFSYTFFNLTIKKLFNEN